MPQIQQIPSHQFDKTILVGVTNRRHAVTEEEDGHYSVNAHCSTQGSFCVGAWGGKNGKIYKTKRNLELGILPFELETKLRDQSSK